MNIAIHHVHSKEEAKGIIDALIEDVSREYKGQIQRLKTQWTNYTNVTEVTAKGYSISGTIEVKEFIISIDLKIPFVLRVFSQKIRGVIEDRVKRTL